MGRYEIGEEGGDSSLRRSTRKRILKKDIDSDYDYDYHKSEFPSTSSFPPPQDFPAIPISTTPKIKKSQKTRAPKRTKFPVADEMLESEIVFGEFSNEMHNSMDYSLIFNESVQPRLIDPEKERLMLDSVVKKLEMPDLRILNTSDIIAIHCENLKRRMESITHLYLESRSASPTEVVNAPNIYYEDDDDDTQFYEEQDSDELTVNMVVNDLIDAVVYLLE